MKRCKKINEKNGKEVPLPQSSLKKKPLTKSRRNRAEITKEFEDGEMCWIMYHLAEFTQQNIYHKLWNSSFFLKTQ